MNSIQLDLTQDEVNLILASLQVRPYAEVAPLIQKIVEQGEPQTEAGN